MASIVSRGFNFIVSDKTITDEEEFLNRNTFVYSTDENRVFKIFEQKIDRYVEGLINPVIAVDKTGSFIKVLFLNTETCHRVIGIPRHFDFREYAGMIK